MDNPYQQTPYSSDRSSSQDLIATHLAVNELSKSKGWIRFISVLLFILAGIFTLSFIAVMMFVGRLGGVMALGVLITLSYLTVTIFLGVRLTGYANAIGRMIHNRNSFDLESAMIQQMKFWRLLGIVMIISVIIKIFALAA